MKLQYFIILMVLCASSGYAYGNIDYDNEFFEFVTKYKKEYPTAIEYAKRFEIFKKNFEMIFNTQPYVEWNMEINEFADMEWDEFKDSKLLLINHNTKQENTNTLAQCAKHGESCVDKECCNTGIFNCALYNINGMSKTRICQSSTEKTLDWRTKGVVNPVKNQGNCGSCWAFSAIGSLESRCAISTGKLYSLSEQQLVDCSSAYGNKKCKGGSMSDAFDYLQHVNGSCSGELYPYIEKGGACKNKKYTDCNLCKVTSFKSIEQSDLALEEALQTGPVSVGFSVNKKFQFYSDGVYDDPKCGTNLNHGVVIVGYTPDYWIVRNSWGESWGTENGYAHIKRGKNMCGIELDATYPIIN